MLNNIFALTVGFAIAAIVGWEMEKIIGRPYRKNQLSNYWRAFNNENDCENAWEFYKDGMHIHRKYSVSFEEIGCADESMFRLSALRKLQRAMNTLYVIGDQSSDSFDGRAAKIRAGIANLINASLHEDEREAVENTFIATT